MRGVRREQGLLVLAVSPIVGFIVWFGYHEVSDQLDRARKQRIRGEYERLVEAVERDPANREVLSNLVEYYRSFKPAESWARVAFFSELIRLRPLYADRERQGLVAELILPEIRAGLHDKDELVRFHAASVAGRFDELSAPVVDDLVWIMTNYPNLGSGLLAVRALGEIGPLARAALSALEKLLHSDKDAQEAIDRITGASQQ